MGGGRSKLIILTYYLIENLHVDRMIRRIVRHKTDQPNNLDESTNKGKKSVDLGDGRSSSPERVTELNSGERVLNEG